MIILFILCLTIASPGFPSQRPRHLPLLARGITDSHLNVTETNIKLYLTFYITLQYINHHHHHHQFYVCFSTLARVRRLNELAAAGTRKRLSLNEPAAGGTRKHLSLTTF